MKAVCHLLEVRGHLATSVSWLTSLTSERDTLLAERDALVARSAQVCAVALARGEVTTQLGQEASAPSDPNAPPTAVWQPAPQAAGFAFVC